MKSRRDVLVNDVYYTVRDQDVGCDDLSAVHENIASLNGDGEVHAIHGHDGLVHEERAIGDSTVDN